MLTGSDVALARISDVAYLDRPSSLPSGFTPVSPSVLNLSLSSKESFADGVYLNRNGAALVLVGTLDGTTTAVLAFRGSDDREDSINDLQNVNREYQLFPTLIAGFDAWVARSGIGQVVVTGHSLGGAMTQLYLASHADTAATRYLGETFGSPGAVIAAGSDGRITNVRISDDPAVYLGENRASVGAQLQSNPLLAAAAVFAGPEVFPGLDEIDVIVSIPTLDTNYVNRGTASLLPDASGRFATIRSLYDAADAGKSEHVIRTYLARAQASSGSDGNDQAAIEITPTTTGVQVFRFFDARNGSHFFTTSTSERDTTIGTRSDLIYEGVGLNATAVSANAAPVFRFFDGHNGSHLYTTSTSEQATLQQAGSGFVAEGIAFYESTTKQAGNTAVYRFFDKDDGSHFFTASGNERAGVFATPADLVNEGVAFYTPTS